ncbi:ATP-dependent helicase/deoxyribonuclease subunit B [subsurface metagenome]
MVREFSAGFDVQTRQIQPIQVRKHDRIMGKLLNYTTGIKNGNYFSPSALNSLIDCSLQFYFRYIAGLQEPVELQEEVDPALFGTLLHESISKIYATLDNPVERADLEVITGDHELIRKAIDESFRKLIYKESGSGTKPEGRNLVIREIIFTYLEKILERDKEYCPINIFSLELPYYASLDFKSGGQDYTVNIGGKIDRIDETGGYYRVIDYKTGKGDMNFESIESLFEGEQKNRNRAAFQTFLYAKVFKAIDGMEEAKVMPGVYLIRDIYNRDFSYRFGMGLPRKHSPITDYSALDELFTSHLQGLFSGLYDPEVPFQQTAQYDTCKYCPYSGICHR